MHGQALWKHFRENNGNTFGLAPEFAIISRKFHLLSGAQSAQTIVMIKNHGTPYDQFGKADFDIDRTKPAASKKRLI